MMKRFLLLPIIILTAALVSFSYADNWTIYTSDMGHYAISFPGNPLERSEFDTTEDNVPFAVHFLSYSQADTQVYILGWINVAKFYPVGKNITEILQDYKNEAAQSMNAYEVVVLNTNTGRYPYIEFTFKTNNFIGKDRIYVVNKYKYSVIALGPPATGITPDMDKFVTSFLYLP